MRPSRVFMAISHADAAETMISVLGSESTSRAIGDSLAGSLTNHSRAFVSRRTAAGV